MTIYKYWDESWVKTEYKELSEILKNNKFATLDKLKSIHLDSNFHVSMYYYEDQFGHTSLFVEDNSDKFKSWTILVSLIDSIFELLYDCKDEDEEIIKEVLKKHMESLK